MLYLNYISCTYILRSFSELYELILCTRKLWMRFFHPLSKMFWNVVVIYTARNTKSSSSSMYYNLNNYLAFKYQTIVLDLTTFFSMIIIAKSSAVIMVFLELSMVYLLSSKNNIPLTNIWYMPWCVCKHPLCDTMQLE